MSNEALMTQAEVHAVRRERRAAAVCAKELIRRSPADGFEVGQKILDVSPKTAVVCFEAALQAGVKSREVYCQLGQAHAHSAGSFFGLFYSAKHGQKAIESYQKARLNERDHSMDAAILLAYVNNYRAPAPWRIFPPRNQKALTHALQLAPTAIVASPIRAFSHITPILRAHLNHENRQLVRTCLVPALKPYVNGQFSGSNDEIRRRAQLLYDTIKSKSWI